jgi:hypothetical protein
VTFRLLALFAFSSLGTLVVSARHGYVQTRDGQILEGQVRFGSNTVIVANADLELRAEIALTNVGGITFSREPKLTLPETWIRSGSGLPKPWESEDIGSAQYPGGADFGGGGFRVRSSGTNILAESDSFHFVFKRIEGASEIVARVTSVQFTDPWARAGLMMRESLAANSRNVLWSITPVRGGVFQSRERLGENTGVRLDGSLSLPCWLKLKRDGDWFTGFKSPNGKQWVPVEKFRMSAARELYVGLAVTGGRQNVMNQSVFEQVEEGPTLRNRWFVPEVELLSGSMQIGYIASMDDTAIHFEGELLKTPVSKSTVATVRFQSLPGRLAAMLNTGRFGVLLTSGEFIDGDCRKIEEGKVILSSVPLGLCRFDINSEVIALVLRKRSTQPWHPYRVQTVDGSVWLAMEVSLEREGLLLREPSLGVKRIPLHEVLELQRRS